MKKEENGVRVEGAPTNIEAQPVNEGKVRPMDTRLPGQPEAEIKKKGVEASAEESTRAPADQQKASLSDGHPRIRLGLQQKTEEEAAGEKNRTGQQQPPTKEDKASVEDKRLEETASKAGVDFKAVRTRVAHLFEDNPEKCLTFLDTLEPQLMGDPIIRSYQQRALQARKERGAEIILTKPKKRSDPDPKGKGIVCPVCGRLNAVGSKYCSQCYALIKDIPPAEVETEPGTKPEPSPPGARVKSRLPSPAEAKTKSPTRQAIAYDTAKYYLTAVAALMIIGGLGWLLYRHFGLGPTAGPAPEIIGTAETAVDAELREGTKIIDKLPRGTPLDILHQPGTSNRLAQDPDSFLPVRTKPAMGGKILSGSIKVSDLDQLKISGDKAYTGWHSLWLALHRFPDTELTDPTDLRRYLESVNERIDAHSEVAPPPELIKKQAIGYLSLARHSKNPDEITTVCKKAEHYIESLASGELQMLSAEYQASCTPAAAAATSRPQTARPSCGEEITKDINAKFEEANDMYEDDRFSDADRIYQQISRAKPCNEEIRKIREQAQIRHERCVAKLRKE